MGDSMLMTPTPVVTLPPRALLMALWTSSRVKVPPSGARGMRFRPLRTWAQSPCFVCQSEPELGLSVLPLNRAGQQATHKEALQ